jgi:hypothetical protein
VKANPAMARYDGLRIVPVRVGALARLVGDVVFLPCNQGEGGKGPITPSWQKMTRAQMTMAHFRQCESWGYRIGVGLGQQSGGLCVLDGDCEEFFDEVLRLNPRLAGTLTTRCNRGAALWVRIADAWPANKSLFWHGQPVGEWRATGNQAIIAGQDTKTGNWRRYVREAPALVLRFGEIRWPDGVTDSSGAPWPGDPSGFESLSAIGDVERVLCVTTRSTSPDGVAAQERAEKLERLFQDLLAHVPTGPRQRNAFICHNVPYLFHAVCQPLALRLALRYYDEHGKPSGWRGDRETFAKSVQSVLEAIAKKYLTKLPTPERRVYEKLTDDTERAAFRICRDLALRRKRAKDCGPGVFPMPFGELAVRLECSNKRAETILKARFRGKLRILRVEEAGMRRAKGQKGQGTRWRYLLVPEGQGTSVN